VREALRVKHYAIRTEQAYCGWIRRYIKFHGMRSRVELLPGTEKVELSLSDLAEQASPLTIDTTAAPPEPLGILAFRSAGWKLSLIHI